MNKSERPIVLSIVILFALYCAPVTRSQSKPATTVHINLTPTISKWEGWGSSLAWWGRAIGGTANADFYADLIYTTKVSDGVPGLGLNVVRYNVGGGGINQSRENKGPKLQWQMDIHGYWTQPDKKGTAAWDWTVDANQRAMMIKARERGANVFEMFSDSPMWWMNLNRSTSGSDTGGDCLAPANYHRFAVYLATVARHAALEWGIHFGSVEPFNEPSADWWKYPNRQEGCHFDVRTQQRVAQELRRELDRIGLKDVVVAAADENDMDAGLATWQAYDDSTRSTIGKVNVHGYFRGTDPYRGPNRAALRRTVGNKRLWQSEYGEPDGTGYTMAVSIIRDLKELQPNAWVYWQPVEPDSGWGMLNAAYVDTHDQIDSRQKTNLIRVNRKFYVFGQFTRYVRPGCQIVTTDDEDTIAAYDKDHGKLVIVSVAGEAGRSIRFDLSKFKIQAQSAQRIVTTTAPGNGVPDWQQHIDTVVIDHGKDLDVNLLPRSVSTFVVEGVVL